MSLVLELVLGLIRGMGGPDLRKWADNLPGALGEELGAIVRGALRPDNSLSEEGLGRISKWLQNHRDEAVVLSASLLQSRHAGAAGDSLIPEYVRIANTVRAVAVQLGRPIVICGFFHDDACLSYWHFDPDRAGSVAAFEKHPDLDLLMFGAPRPDVYILEDRATDELIRRLNLKIRMDDFHQLDYSCYSGRPQVETVREFRVEFEVGFEASEIPLGAPGVAAMLASLPLAVEAQAMPGDELQKTLG